jgi:hypothetical protein
MRTARLIATLIVAGTLCTFVACSDTAKPLGTGDMFTNDTLGQDVSSPPVPTLDSGAYNADAYGSSMNACVACSCDPTKNYCFSGGGSTASAPDGATTAADTGDNGDSAGAHFPLAIPLGGFGEPDGAAEAGPPLPACPIVAAGSLGCSPLPAACTASPSCACLLSALQSQHSTCYLDCTPTPGFDVYCGG